MIFLSAGDHSMSRDSKILGTGLSARPIRFAKPVFRSRARMRRSGSILHLPGML